VLKRRPAGPKKEEVIERWRKVHNEVLHNLYSLFNVISVIKLRRMSFTGYLLSSSDEKMRQMGRRIGGPGAIYYSFKDTLSFIVPQFELFSG
jgi:hypothetical protein